MIKKKKDHPKLINPSNTIKIIYPQMNEIKEETIEESLDNSLIKKKKFNNYYF